MRILVAFVVACGGGSSAPIANTSDRTVAPAPDRDQLIELLRPHAGHSLRAVRGERGCPAEETLGVWTARLIEYGTPKPDGDTHRLTGGCGPHDAVKMTYLAPPAPGDSDRYWYCTIDAFSSDPAGESPWACSLFVRVRKADRSVDLDSIVCPGTC